MWFSIAMLVYQRVNDHVPVRYVTKIARPGFSDPGIFGLNWLNQPFDGDVWWNIYIVIIVNMDIEVRVPPGKLTWRWNITILKNGKSVPTKWSMASITVTNFQRIALILGWFAEVSPKKSIKLITYRFPKWWISSWGNRKSS